MDDNLNRVYSCREQSSCTTDTGICVVIVFLFFVCVSVSIQCDDFVASPDVGEHSRFFVKTFFENAKNGVSMKQYKMTHQLTKKDFVTYVPAGRQWFGRGGDDNIDSTTTYG